MKYEYFILKLNSIDEVVNSVGFNMLQEWFDNGWDYVDSIQQNIATGGVIRKPIVAVILRREKTEEVKL